MAIYEVGYHPDGKVAKMFQPMFTARHTIQELREELELMQAALKKPVLDYGEVMAGVKAVDIDG